MTWQLYVQRIHKETRVYAVLEEKGLFGHFGRGAAPKPSLRVKCGRYWIKMLRIMLWGGGYNSG